MSTVERESLAVLLSGGLDSAILLGEAAQRGARVFPLFIRGGLRWERAELAHARRFVRALKRDNAGIEPLRVLDVPADDLLAGHWSTTGESVPGASTPDEAVFLPGRNVLLLGKAMIWCHLNGVPSVAMATLRGNPFPDATASFVARFQAAVNEAIGGNVTVLQPYATLSKRDVMLRGKGMPLELTFSCINPIRGRHCGDCNKCAERRAAFADAGMIDRTRYAVGVAD